MKKLHFILHRGKAEISDLNNAWKAHMQAKEKSQTQIENIEKQCKTLNDVITELNGHVLEVEEETKDLEVS